jgi:cysteine desulfurase family protein
MNHINTIYLDNAATSHPKPRCVYEEVAHCIRDYCGNPGRGSHPMALAAANKIYECREALANYFCSDSPERVIFTLNATYALNFALKGLLHPGDHVLISDMEHNAVLRPIDRLAREGLITYDIFPTMLSSKEERDARNPTRLCARIAARLKPNTRAVVCSHQSNICSASLPLHEIGAFCHRHHLLFIVDASQSAGHLPIDVKAMNIDALCAPGHKGLYGIQGCGFCLLGEDLEADTLVEGGSGYASLDATMPDVWPERGEAGTLPTPAIAGLWAGVNFLSGCDAKQVSAHECALFDRLYDRLSSMKGYSVYLPEYRGSTLMFHREGVATEKIGQYLARRGICVRTGYHCAALGHKTLGTPDGGGVRVSFGLFNTPREVDALCRTLWDMEKTFEMRKS